MLRPSTTNARPNGASPVHPKAATSSISNKPSGSVSPTVREIRSRTSPGNSGNNISRQLLANKRQTMSMDKLNSTPSGNLSGDKDKCSPTSGSSSSINTTSSSPSRGLNRTASRVSRFRSAKAVFERLSSANASSSSLNSRPQTERSTTSADVKARGTVASRYAAAAAARAQAAQQTKTAATSSSPVSPRSRLQAGGGTSVIPSRPTTNQTTKSDAANQPRPQPRVMTTSANSRITRGGPESPKGRSASQATKVTPATSTTTTTTTTIITNTAKQPPPKDLIDKIVLEIARDPRPDPNCTIQDLSNCDISGIPETLDFDQCFQDVEMMTEEEARRLLSKKTESASSLASPTSCTDEAGETQLTKSDQLDGASASIGGQDKENKPTNVSQTITSINLNSSTGSNSSSASNKSKVRFSEEPARIFDTHAVEDYDRRNDDIDPVAASAEYEIEKSRERQGLRDGGQEDSDEEKEEVMRVEITESNGAVITSNPLIDLSSSRSTQVVAGSRVASANSPDNPRGILADHGLAVGGGRSATAAQPQTTPQDGGATTMRTHDSSVERNNGESHGVNATCAAGKPDDHYSKDYVESLEREVSLKRILESNLRDLQSQYYEAVKELDEFKNVTEAKVSSLEENLQETKQKLECSQGELLDSREKAQQFEGKFNDINESSQILEKKYHRAKRIIKDMQSREQSFNRREQLYQQKLDEIEHELGVLIDSIDRTVYEDGLKFYSLTDANKLAPMTTCQHQARLDVFGLLRHMMNNFSANQTTQNPQIKQRVVSILEQQLANLMMLSNGNTATSAIITSSSEQQDLSAQMDHHKQTSKQQHYPLASHRLSQPNLPHPIGVGGQPTKVFHGLNPMPMPMPLSNNNNNNESPPQSVNSYPSSNSLNSLNNNNNNGTSNNNNNNTIVAAKVRDHQAVSDLQLNMTSMATATNSSLVFDEKFKPIPDAPFQTNEWHDKPVSEWTTHQVSTWLLALGLDQYISKFEDRNVNGQSLINLDSTVLKGLGVLNSNDRNLLKKKIRELRVEMEKERKLVEKKLKENLKDKSKSGFRMTIDTQQQSQQQPQQSNRSSWKKGLLS